MEVTEGGGSEFNFNRGGYIKIDKEKDMAEEMDQLRQDVRLLKGTCEAVSRSPSEDQKTEKDFAEKWVKEKGMLRIAAPAVS